MKPPPIRPRQDGFTLIEIIAVLILLGILAAVAGADLIRLQREAEVRAVHDVKSELTARANQYYAMYLLDNTKTENSQTAAAWAAENPGSDFSLDSPDDATITVTVISSGNAYDIEFTRGLNAADGTGYPARFGAVTPN